MVPVLNLWKSENIGGNRLRALHWLPVQLRVIFEMLLFAYQCFRGISPSYLSDLLVKYEPRRNLRSSQKDLYVVPQISTNFYGKRSFGHAAPDLWNGLPNHVKYADTVEKFKTSKILSFQNLN